MTYQKFSTAGVWEHGFRTGFNVACLRYHGERIVAINPHDGERFEVENRAWETPQRPNADLIPCIGRVATYGMNGDDLTEDPNGNMVQLSDYEELLRQYNQLAARKRIIAETDDGMKAWGEAVASKLSPHDTYRLQLDQLKRESDMNRTNSENMHLFAMDAIERAEKANAETRARLDKVAELFETLVLPTKPASPGDKGTVTAAMDGRPQEAERLVLQLIVTLRARYNLPEELQDRLRSVASDVRHHVQFHVTYGG